MQLQTDSFTKDLQRWRDAYLRYMLTQDYSNNTIELYERIVNELINYSEQYENEMKIEDIRSTYFNEFIIYLEDGAKKRGKRLNRSGRYLSKSTKDTYMKAIKSFFNYISDNNDELRTFERYLKNRTRDKSKPEEKMKHLTEDEVQKLTEFLNHKQSYKDDYISHRNSLLIKLMLHAGLRISEALSIQLQDFSEAQNKDIFLIEVYGKGGKTQTAYIVKKHIESEMEYFNEVANIKEDDYIMRTKNGTQLDRRSAFTIVNRIYKKIGIKKRGLHILRHTLAMHLTDQKVNPLIIKKVLRHASISTTTIYAKASEQSVDAALISSSKK